MRFSAHSSCLHIRIYDGAKHRDGALPSNKSCYFGMSCGVTKFCRISKYGGVLFNPARFSYTSAAQTPRRRSML